MVSDLSEKQLKVLSHIRDFRMGVPEILARVHFPGESPEAVKSFLRRLRTRGLIDSAALFGKYSYYHLCPAAAALFDEDPRRCKALTPGPLAERFGVLLFACARDPLRKPLPEHQFKGSFPELFLPKLQHRNYYLDDDGKRRLGYVLVDLGASPGAVAKKARENIIGPRREDENWQKQFFASSNCSFALSVVTANEIKAKLIEDELLVEPMLEGVRVRVEAFEELRSVLAVKRERRAKKKN